VTACCPFCGAEYDVAAARCWECKVALVEPGSTPALPPDPGTEEVVYELDDWPVEARVQLTAVLAERGVACRWEPGMTLVVAAADDEATERVLDDIEEGELADGAWDDDEDDEDDDEDDDVLSDREALVDAVDGLTGDHDTGDDDDAGEGGDIAQAAMADLFVAADRLMHEPDDELVAAELGAAAAVVDDSPPPYGIDGEMWNRVRELAAVVVANLDAQVDDDDVARDARVLRDVLRPWI